MATKGIREKFMLVREDAFKEGGVDLFGDEELYDSAHSAAEDFAESSTTTESYIVCRVIPEKRLVRGPVQMEIINGN